MSQVPFLQYGPKQAFVRLHHDEALSGFPFQQCFQVVTVTKAEHPRGPRGGRCATPCFPVGVPLGVEEPSPVPVNRGSLATHAELDVARALHRLDSAGHFRLLLSQGR